MPPTKERWTRWGIRKAPEASGADAVPEPALLDSKTALAVPGLQKRSFVRAVFADKRAAGGSTGRMVSGAIPFGVVLQTPDGFGEMFQRGCFVDSLAKDDPRVLCNFNPAHVLGRKSAGTASFREDGKSLRFELEMPATSYADDTLVLLRRGDVDSVAAVFYVLDYRWEGREETRVRVIVKAQLVAASICSFDGYQTAQCDAEQELASARALGFRLGLAEAKASRNKGEKTW